MLLTNVDIDKLGKNLQNAFQLEIMYTTLEKYENDIHTNVASDQKRAGRIVPGRRILGHCPRKLPPVFGNNICTQSARWMKRKRVTGKNVCKTGKCNCISKPIHMDGCIRL